MATIKDIAGRARVSTATVSHVINQTTYVSPALRERVIKAIRELNYHPNSVARSLKTKKSKTVGMIIPDITNPFFPAVVRGAEDVLHHEGYTLILGNSDGALQKEEMYYRTFRAKRVDGILLIVSPSPSAPEYLRQHNPDGLPIVYVDRFHRGVRGDVVAAENIKGSSEGVSHLLTRGHRRTAIITGPLELINARQRLEGYKRALKAHRIPVMDELIRPGKFDVESGYEQTKYLLSLNSPPTAIFVSNALMTTGCLRAFRDLGVRCPDDVAVVSFDDLEWFDLSSPRITAVTQPAYELGATAAELLVKRFSGKLSGSPCRKLLPTRLIIRESSVSGRGRTTDLARKGRNRKGVLP
jgi:LacI family transcriptional regulator